jgi:uncharacterized protein YjgD (DUF1641 family)
LESITERIGIADRITYDNGRKEVIMMDENKLQNQIDEINRKLDIIVGEIELQKSNRRGNEDLKDDLMRVGRDLYETAVNELEEVHDYLETGDILYLFKKLLRNVNNITKSLEQIDNLKDFIQDFGPVSRQLSKDVMAKLDEFDRKGYFDFISELKRALDNILTTFAVDDVKLLADNSALILRTVKNLTDPELLKQLNKIISSIREIEINSNEKISTFQLIKELKSPEVKRGLAFTEEILRTLGKHI